jgi:hypothetical protein
VLERRQSRRFRVSWDVTITATDSSGSIFGQAGTVENLSSTGAFLYLSKGLELGTQAEVSIRVPLKRENWMKYSARVVRSEMMPSRVGVAIRFDSVRPSFTVF